MYYEVYLDILFLINGVMDFILLRLVNRLSHDSGTWKNSLWGAVTGAAGYCFLVLIPWNRWIHMIVAHGLINTIMVKIGCKPETVFQLIRKTVLLYGASFLLGGLLEVLLRITGEKGLLVFLVISGISYLILSLGIRWYLLGIKKTERKYKVWLYVNNRYVESNALLDTGNSLRDIGGKKSVSIGSFELLEQLLPKTTVMQLEALWEGKNTMCDFGKLNPHFIPFTGLGCSRGLALAVTFDYLRLEGQEIHKVISRPVIAFSKENSSFGGDYQVILHPDLIDRQEEFI